MSEKNAKKSDVWMPLFIGDYLADTQRLTTEQHGAYLLLLMDYWRNGPPPADDAVLAQIARLKPAAWRKMKPVIVGFFRNEGGRLIHSRVEAERLRAVANQSRRSEKAKAAADTRWQKGKDARGNAPSMPGAMLGGCSSPSPTSVPKGTGAKPPSDPVKDLIDSGVQLLKGAGSSEASARGLIGKWRKAVGDDEVRAGIAAATRLAIAEPKSWLTARFNAAADSRAGFYASLDHKFGGNAGMEG